MSWLSVYLAPCRGHLIHNIVLIRNFTYDVLGQFVAWQIFHVLVCGVDDFGQFLALDHFLKHVHRDTICNDKLNKSFFVSTTQ